MAESPKGTKLPAPDLGVGHGTDGNIPEEQAGDTPNTVRSNPVYGTQNRREVMGKNSKP